MRIGVFSEDNFSPPRMRVIHVRSQPTMSASFWSVNCIAFIASATVLYFRSVLIVRAMQGVSVTDRNFVKHFL